LKSVGLSGTGSGANRVVAQALRDRLKTQAFRQQVMNRSGLTDAILAGEWPEPSQLQRQLNSLPILRNVSDILGLAPPDSVNEALVMGIRTAGRSLKVSTSGNNLIIVVYSGSEPVLGQRLIEETLSIHQEEALAARTRESEVGTEYLTRELQTQEERFLASAAKLERFEAQFPPPPFGLQRPGQELQELQNLQQAVELNRTAYIAALNRLESLRLASSAAMSTADLYFRLMDPPISSGGGAGVSPRTMGMMGMLGVTLGTLLGIVAIVLTTWRDGMIRTRADVERTIETPAIVEVPLLTRSLRDRSLLLMVAIGLATADGEDS